MALGLERMGFVYWVIVVHFPLTILTHTKYGKYNCGSFRQDLAEHFQYLMYKGHAFKSFKPSIDTTLFESYFDKSAFKLNWPI